MSTHRIRLDDLVGRKVRDAQGCIVGRLFEMRAEERDGELVVVEYFLGAHALAVRVGLSFLDLVGIERPKPRRIPWDRLDISDPDAPRLLGS